MKRRIFSHKMKPVMAGLTILSFVGILTIGGCNEIKSEVTASASVGSYSLAAEHEAKGVKLDRAAIPSIELCTASCHSYSKLASDTAGFDQHYNVHGSHYGQLECNGCHSMAGTPELWCTTCHTGLKLPEGWMSVPQGTGF